MLLSQGAGARTCIDYGQLLAPHKRYKKIIAKIMKRNALTQYIQSLEIHHDSHPCCLRPQTTIANSNENSLQNHSNYNPFNIKPINPCMSKKLSQSVEGLIYNPNSMKTHLYSILRLTKHHPIPSRQIGRAHV